MKTISIVTHAYNEEDNIEAMYLRIREIMQAYPQYAYEHIFIDNHSTDSTVAILTRIAAADRHVKLIVNARNFAPEGLGKNWSADHAQRVFDSRLRLDGEKILRPQSSQGACQQGQDQRCAPTGGLAAGDCIERLQKG